MPMILPLLLFAGGVYLATRSGVRANPTDMFTQFVDAYERGEAPPGPTTSRRGTRCSASDALWGPEYRKHLDAVMAGEVEWAHHPMAAEWDRVANECVREYRVGHAMRQRRTTTATSETLERLRAAGVSMDANAEHLDMLTSSGRAAFWRRQYGKTGSKFALEQARAAERQRVRR